MSICDNDIILFHQACREIINRERASMGIGTLSEKTVHAVLKRFYEPDPEHQEIPVENFIADILRDGEIIEIQTRGFNKLRRKLDTFLKYYPVTIVYPIIHTKWLYWINEETGELSPKRKSPKTGTFYDAVPELYKIKMYLDNPNLHLCLVLIDADEYRLLNGWSRDRKKGSSRFDRIPVELVDELYIGDLSLRDFPKITPRKILQKPLTFRSAMHRRCSGSFTFCRLWNAPARAGAPTLIEIHSKPLSNIISGYAARQVIPPAIHFRSLTHWQTCLLLSAQFQFHSPGFQLLRCLTWIISLQDRRNHTDPGNRNPLHNIDVILIQPTNRIDCDRHCLTDFPECIRRSQYCLNLCCGRIDRSNAEIIRALLIRLQCLRNRLCGRSDNLIRFHQPSRIRYRQIALSHMNTFRPNCQRNINTVIYDQRHLIFQSNLQIFPGRSFLFAQLQKRCPSGKRLLHTMQKFFLRIWSAVCYKI